MDKTFNGINGSKHTLCTLQWQELTSLKLHKLYRLKAETFPKTFNSMPVLRKLWVEDFGHCVTKLIDVIRGGGDVSCDSKRSLPHLLLSLSLANTLYDLSAADVEMLASVLPDWRNLDITGVEMSQGLVATILSHFDQLKMLYYTEVLETAEQQTAHLPAFHKDCRIVALPHVQ